MSRKIDFGDRQWAAHAQDHWLEMAGNPDFPDYLRVLFVAYGRHAANGHAVLEREELAYYLIRKSGTLPERRVVWRAVRGAVRLGYLAEGSHLLCLVVSSHAVQGGKGSVEARCKRDHTRRGPARADERGRFETNVRNDCGRSETNVRNDARRSETNVRNDCGRSVLGPSLSSIPDNQPPQESAS